MSFRAVLASLPEGYDVVHGHRGVLAVERGCREPLLRSGFVPDGGESLPRSDLAGRSALEAIECGGRRWVVRRFHHGGILRGLGQRLFLAPERPFLELCLADRLATAGVPTPPVIAARALRGTLGWQLALVTERVEGVLDGWGFLERMRRGELDPLQRAAFLGRAGHLIGRLHALGFLHADLTPRNVLVAHALGTAWILDLDRGRFVASLSARRRRDNLRRLYRWVRRREARGRPFLRACDYLRFLRGYEGGREDAGNWRADWRAIVARDRARQPWHRASWLVEGLLGGGPETRDGPAAVRE